jgi:pyruvate-formate lyase-activating enzyme
MWEQLEIAAQMQHYWADNQVSVTITFKPEEASQIKQALEFYESRLKSVSFLPLKNHGYEHAPYQPMTKEEYQAATKKLKPLNLEDTTETEGYEHKFCDNDVCELPSTRPK